MSIGRVQWIAVMSLLGCGADVAGGDSSSGGVDTSGASSSSTSSTGAEVDGSSGSSSGGSSSDGGSTGADESTTGGGAPVDAGCPECIVLVDGLTSGRGIAVDASHVFFTDQGAGVVGRVQKGGGDGDEIASGQDEPYDLAVDDDRVYWTNAGDGGGVMAVGKRGGTVEPIDGDGSARAIAVDDTHVYWSSFAAGQGSVMRRRLDLGGETEELAYELAGVADLVLDDTRVYYTVHGDVDGGVAFIMPPPQSHPVGSIASIAKDPTQVDKLELAGDMAEPWGIALEGGALFWVTGDGDAAHDAHQVRTMELGAGASTMLAGSQDAPWGIVADANWVYWTDNDDVKAVPRDGGDVVVLATMQAHARSIAVDDGGVYWITESRVLQRAKPQ